MRVTDLIMSGEESIFAICAVGGGVELLRSRSGVPLPVVGYFDD